MTKAIDALREKGQPFYLICTGGAAGVQGHLWNKPGISDILLGAEFPYAKEATDTCLGFEPAKYVVPETAVDLAMAAYYKAVSTRVENPIGLGLTAAVASNRAHRGDHRVFIATVTIAGCRLYLAELHKGEGAAQRLKDGALCDTLALGALVKAAGLPTALLSEDLSGAIAALKAYKAEEDINALVEDRFFARPYFSANGKRLEPVSCKGFILPGAFNPPHEGHFHLAKAALQQPHKCESHVTFAVTQRPPHKDPLSVPEMLRRAKLLEGRDRMFTRFDPLYIDKARQHRGASFVVGVDAAERLFDSKWGNTEDQLRQFDELGTKFYVAGRVTDAGTFKTLADVPIPSRWIHLFHSVPGRWDFSSSAIRAAK